MRFEPGLLKAIIEGSAPRGFTQHARNPRRSVFVGLDNVVFAPAYGTPFVHDMDRGGRVRIDDGQCMGPVVSPPVGDSPQRNRTSGDQRKPAIQTGEALKIAIRGMHLGPMRDRELGNLRVGDEVAAMRSGCGQQFQHIVNMPRARIQHTRHLAITPGLSVRLVTADPSLDRPG